MEPNDLIVQGKTTTYKGNQCGATSKQSGKRCQRPAIPGGTVCKLHGGGAPQVIRKARLRLQELVDPAIATLAREMATADKSNDRQRAANSILDRAGVVRGSEIKVEDVRESLVDTIRAIKASSTQAAMLTEIDTQPDEGDTLDTTEDSDNGE